MSLPWKEECQPIASGYLACVNRLRHTHSRLKKDPEILKEYSNVIKQQQELGIIERIAEEPGHDKSAHHLPHHVVVRREKSTTFELCLMDPPSTGNQHFQSTNVSKKVPIWYLSFSLHWSNFEDIQLESLPMSKKLFTRSKYILMTGRCFDFCGLTTHSKNIPKLFSSSFSAWCSGLRRVWLFCRPLYSIT